MVVQNPSTAKHNFSSILLNFKSSNPENKGFHFVFEKNYKMKQNFEKSINIGVNGLKMTNVITAKTTN